MPLFEYILIVLLGSSGIPNPESKATLGADAIVQPNGGAMSVGQDPPKKDDRRVGKRTTNFTRHKHSRRPIKHIYAPKKDGGSRHT